MPIIRPEGLPVVALDGLGKIHIINLFSMREEQHSEKRVGKKKERQKNWVGFGFELESQLLHKQVHILVHLEPVQVIGVTLQAK